MLDNTKEKITYLNFVFFSLLLPPILAIAPLGSWVLLFLATISCSFFSKSIYKKIFSEGLLALLIITFFWITISIIFIAKNFFLLEKALHFFLIILSVLVVSKVKINNLDLKKITFFFSISFIISVILIIVDTHINLGLKLWLSKNFDFSNFEHVFKLRNWINFNDFKENYFLEILSYNKYTYSRGIIGLSLLSLPLFTLCNFFNLKKLSYIIIFFTISLALLTFNFTVLFSYTAALILSAIFYFQKTMFKKYFLFFFGLYFLLCPFILGLFEYRKFSEYESYFQQTNNDLFIKYCGNTTNPRNKLYRNKNSINLKCCNYAPNSSKKMDKKYNEICHNKEFNNKFISEDYSEKIKLFIKYKFNETISKKLHRLIIWSYSKEKILEKPIIGHGFFASRYIASEQQITKWSTEYQLIPLHPHNNILQIWLELGILGLIIFFVFISVLLKKIYEFSSINHKYAAISMMSFFQVFFIGQISFGFWQSWWISLVLICFILYRFVFRAIKFGEPQLSSSN